MSEANGNTLEDALALRLLTVSFRVSFEQMFVNFGISIDEKERFILTLFRNDTMYCHSFSRFSHFKNQNGRAVELFSRV